MSVVGARNTIDWVSGAWANIQATTSSTGIAILDAVAGKNNKLPDGLSIAAGQQLATAFASIQQSIVSEQNYLAGQRALERVQKELLAVRNPPADTPLTTRSAITGNIINIST